MCGVINRPNAPRCDCGHDFEDESGLRELLRGRLTTGWCMVVGGLLLTMGSVLAVVFVTWPVVFGAVPSIALFRKGTRIVDATQHRLRELGSVPTARLLNG